MLWLEHACWRTRRAHLRVELHLCRQCLPALRQGAGLEHLLSREQPLEAYLHRGLTGARAARAGHVLASLWREGSAAGALAVVHAAPQSTLVQAPDGCTGPRAQATSSRHYGEKDARLEYLSWRVWHLKRKKHMVRKEELDRRARAIVEDDSGPHMTEEETSDEDTVGAAQRAKSDSGRQVPPPAPAAGPAPISPPSAAQPAPC